MLLMARRLRKCLPNERLNVMCYKQRIPGAQALEGERINMASLARFITLPFTEFCRPHSQGLCKSLGVIPSLTHFL